MAATSTRGCSIGSSTSEENRRGSWKRPLVSFDQFLVCRIDRFDEDSCRSRPCRVRQGQAGAAIGAVVAQLHCDLTDLDPRMVRR